MVEIENEGFKFKVRESTSREIIVYWQKIESQFLLTL